MVPNDQQTMDDETGQRIKFDDDDDDDDADADHTNNDVDILTFMDQQQEEDDNDNDLIHLPLNFLWQQDDERKLLLRNNYNERSMRRRRRRRVATESLVEGEEELLIEDDEDQTTIPTDSDGNNSNNINKRRPRKLQEITGVATQYVNFFIGTPAQKRTLAISTGADFTAFPCQVKYHCFPPLRFLSYLSVQVGIELLSLISFSAAIYYLASPVKIHRNAPNVDQPSPSTTNPYPAPTPQYPVGNVPSAKVMPVHATRHAPNAMSRGVVLPMITVPGMHMRHEIMSMWVDPTMK